MRKSVQVRSWAVYQANVLGQPGPNVVCTQAEWEALAKEQPGACRLIRDGITNEGEAERLARGAAGETKPRVQQKKVALLLIEDGDDAVLVAADDDAATEGEGPVILPFSDVPEVIGTLVVFDAPPEQLSESA